MTYAHGGLPMAAEYVRSKGRNEDTQLVHMTPGEVQALQKMAEDHGGSLTINPHTGLPEAGFLGNVLKVAAPVALSYFAGPALGGALAPGASAAMQAGIGAGLIAGGLTALQTGDIGAGLGAGLTSGLLTGGTKALFNPTAASAPGMPTSVVKTPSIPLEALKNAPAYTPGINLAGTDPFAGLGQQAVTQGANVVTPTYASMMQNPAVYKGATEALQLAPTSASAGVDLSGNVAKGVDLSGYSLPTQAAAEPGFFGNLTTGQKLAIGAGGLGLLGALEPQPKLKTAAEDKGMIRPYTYSTAKRPAEAGRTQYVQPIYDAQGNPVLDTRERNYLTQSYTALTPYKAAGGGLMDIGSMDQNNMYPQSQQVHTNFATPTQMPTSSEVIGADYDIPTNPYLGTPLKMAEGGITGYKGYGDQQTAPRRDPAALLNLINQDDSVEQYASGGPISRDEAYASAAKNKYSYDPETQQYTHIEPPPPPPQPALPSRFLGMYRGMGGLNQPYMGMGGMNQEYSGIGGFGMMNRMLRTPKVPKAPALPSYTYDPVAQEYTPLAEGGLANLGSYSDGGQLLKGPGDGVSDDIPAMIGKHQPARLADGEFVVPARIVSELGNGSTDAGAKRLYAMMDRIQAGRKKTVGKGKVAVDSKAEKHLPA